MNKIINISAVLLTLSFSAFSAQAADTADQATAEFNAALANGQTFAEALEAALIASPDFAAQIIELAASVVGEDNSKIDSIMQAAANAGVDAAVVTDAAIKGNPSLETQIVAAAKTSYPESADAIDAAAAAVVIEVEQPAQEEKEVVEETPVVEEAPAQVVAQAPTNTPAPAAPTNTRRPVVNNGGGNGNFSAPSASPN